MRSPSWIILLPAFCFALSSGYLTGRLSAVESADMVLQPDTRPPAPTVHITGVRNGRLTGVIRGDARLILGSSPVVGSGSFAVPAGSLLTNIIEIDVPAGARYVASSRGKKYYPVDAASSRNLSPENRVYFETAAQAEAAGFTR